MFQRKALMVCITLLAALSMTAGAALAAEIKIGITQAQAGDARKYQPLLDYFAKNGIQAKFVTAPDYPGAAEMFAKGAVDAMFSGSGIAGTMIIKGLAAPVARPLSNEGTSTYSAVVIAPKGGPKFTGSGEYFNGKKVIFASLASAGEFYFRSVGASNPKEIMKASSHGAALDALGRGMADAAVIKNLVWNKEKTKFPNLELVGGDTGENPDSIFIVSAKMDAGLVQRLSGILLGIGEDPSSEAAAVRDSLKMQKFIKTDQGDFKHTLAMLQRAGVNRTFAFRF